MEALQVETEYGRSFHVSEDTITVDGRPVAADILRAGRLALFFSTPDEKTVGWYDRAGGEWRQLPGKYGRAINHAAEMARRHRPVDMVKLPLGRMDTQ